MMGMGEGEKMPTKAPHIPWCGKWGIALDFTYNIPGRIREKYQGMPVS